MESFHIQSIQKDDLPALQQISQSTFYETFVNDCAAEDMASFLKEDFSLDKLAAEFENPFSRFYFVESKSEIIGYLKLNHDQAQTEQKLNRALEIERLYVVSAFHGQNIGKMLMEKALQIARKENFQWVWLGVWENNARAIRFYEKFGFAIFDSHIFKVGSDNQTDVLMRLKLE
ncbi:MAG TPA: GNAT family N-acetyltransferase [Bacteroidales bacterium]|nr:GNAT family N-acetyltransferase [Bacteroidales bacterium]